MVVLPAPLGPTNATNWPGRISKLTSRSAQRGSASSSCEGPTEPTDGAFFPPSPLSGTGGACCPQPKRGTSSSPTALAPSLTSSPRYLNDTRSNRTCPRARSNEIAPGRSSISTGRSSTSKTRSKLTMLVAKSTRALLSDASGP